MARVLLINPGWGDLVSRAGGRHNRRWPPLDLLNCAALLRERGLEVELMDGRLGRLDPADVTRRARLAHLVCLTSSPLDRWQCPNLEVEQFQAMARGLSHTRLVILGVHGTLFPQQMLESTGAWALVMGEPEEAVAALPFAPERAAVPGLAWLEDGRLVTSQPRPPVDMAALPMPAFDLAPPKYYEYEAMGGNFALIEASRGCPFHCVFCLKKMYGPGVRYKDLDQVLAEVRAVRDLGAKNLYFMDLEFTANRRRALELCRMLAEEGPGLPWCCQTRVDTVDEEVVAALKKAGCTLVHFGVESGSPRVLEYLRKDITPEQVRRAVELCRRAGIRTACFFMFGFPGETDEDRQATIDLARGLKVDLCSFHMASPYPGTAMAEQCPGLPPFSEYDAVHYQREHLAKTVRQAFLSFYLKPGRLVRLACTSGPQVWAKGARLLAGFLR